MPKSTCSVYECRRPMIARTYCTRHYQQWQVYGEARPDIKTRRDPAERNEHGQKHCRRCEQWLEESAFAKNAATRDGLQSNCRECRKIHVERQYSQGKECSGCSKRITDKSTTGMCLPCRGFSLRGKPYKSGKSKNVQGYMVLSGQYDHPNASARGLVLEHVKVMSEMIGRPLVAGENVHHKNGVRDDNRPENLELWNKSQPAGQRPTDKVAWAVEILELYAPEKLLNATETRVARIA